jgi:DNA-binding NtrC family response regulator
MPGGRHRILVVDDDPIFRWTIATQLQKEDMDVDVAESGREARGLLDRNRDCYCAVVMDLDIPTPTGRELIEELAVQQKNLPIFVVSGHENLIEQLGEAQPNVKAVFIKPVDPAIIAESTMRYCHHGMRVDPGG